MRARFAVLLVTFALGTTPVAAHLLKVFAWAEGDRIHGSAYFSGGARATGAHITILGPGGATLATLEPDAAGEFGYTATVRADHRIVADSLDGHRAEWTVTAAELAADLPPPAQGAVPADSSSGDGPAVPTPIPAPRPADDELAALVERAVARQVGPLRVELQGYADRVRLGDVLGGIGIIFGLAGVVLWWRSRRGSGRP